MRAALLTKTKQSEAKRNETKKKTSVADKERIKKKKRGRYGLNEIEILSETRVSLISHPLRHFK
ncbi:hypothetical protein PGB90_007132 [Kerria lacca]